VRSPPQAFSEPAVEATRPPIALEQQNAQHAFVKLLQRGIQSAEAQLSLTSLVLTLHEERSAYAVIKHKLLNTANNTLQKRNNLSSALGSSNAGKPVSTVFIRDDFSHFCVTVTQAPACTVPGGR